MPVTSRGAGLAAVAVAVLVFANLSRVGWLYLFDAVLWGALLLSAALPWLAAGKPASRWRLARWEGALPYGPAEGDPLELELELKNEGKLPSLFLSVDLGLEDAGLKAEVPRAFIAWLGPGAEAHLRMEAEARRRGWATLEPPSMECAAPFGLLRRTLRRGRPLSFLVFPRTYTVPHLEALTGAAEDGSTDRGGRRGSEVVGSRGYAPGDPVEAIHWKNTARTASPQVKEFHTPTLPDLAVAMGTELASYGSPAALEEAVRVAASVGLAACRQARRVVLSAGSRRLDTLDPRALLEGMATLAPDAGGLIDALRQVPPGVPLLAVVAAGDRAGVGALLRRRTAHPRLAVVVVGDDAAASVARLRTVGIAAVACAAGQGGEALLRLQGLMEAPADARWEEFAQVGER